MLKKPAPPRDGLRRLCDCRTAGFIHAVVVSDPAPVRVDAFHSHRFERTANHSLILRNHRHFLQIAEHYFCLLSFKCAGLCKSRFQADAIALTDRLPTEHVVSMRRIPEDMEPCRSAAFGRLLIREPAAGDVRGDALRAMQDHEGQARRRRRRVRPRPSSVQSVWLHEFALFPAGVDRQPYCALCKRKDGGNDSGKRRLRCRNDRRCFRFAGSCAIIRTSRSHRSAMNRDLRAAETPGRNH